MLQTDHRPLLSMYGSKKGNSTHADNRLQRWGTFLLNYNYKMEVLPSKKFRHADGLSKLIPSFVESLQDTVIAALRAEKELKEVLCNTEHRCCKILWMCLTTSPEMEVPRQTSKRKRTRVKPLSPDPKRNINFWGKLSWERSVVSTTLLSQDNFKRWYYFVLEWTVSCWIWSLMVFGCIS